ncbi:MAG: hypothetical protein LBL07_10385 [Tannerella sp.]|jgi:hypothetical protein|nr:hypothetical protein [Tannerella sp.]
MSTKQLPLVTYGQAKRLKELGFDWECISRYSFKKLKNNQERVMIAHPNIVDWNTRSDMYGWNFISAPAVAQALKWIRDEKGIICGIDRYASYEHTCGWWLDNRNIKRYADAFITYEGSESALLDKLLTILEKKK